MKIKKFISSIVVIILLFQALFTTTYAENDVLVNGTETISDKNTEDFDTTQQDEDDISYEDSNLVNTVQHGTGLAEMSEAEWEAFTNQLPKVLDVKPNEYAIERIKKESNAELLSSDLKTIDIVPLGNEVISSYNSGDTAVLLDSEDTFAILDSIDNSETLYFPTIGNQGAINSCVAWSLCYYQMTNNNCLTKGLDAKEYNSSTNTYSNIESNVMSPRFIYTLINGGHNIATYFNEACSAIMGYGCPTIEDYKKYYPDDPLLNEDNLDEWCTVKRIWTNAIYNKPQNIVHKAINETEKVTINKNSPFVIELKEHLINGYVLTIPTYVNSFVTSFNSSTEESVCLYMDNNKCGAHAMTIVGYDDSYWIDINQDGYKDIAEYGAFKLMNSWGICQQSNCDISQCPYHLGYIWVPYDALGGVSGVDNAPSNRMSLFNEYFLILPSKDYEPLLIAEVELTTTDREQIKIEFGITDKVGANVEFLSLVENGIAFNNASNGFIYRYCECNINDNINADGAYPCNCMIRYYLEPKEKNSCIGDIECDEYCIDNCSPNQLTFDVSSETIIVPFDITPIIRNAYSSKGLKANSNLSIYIKVTDMVDNESSVTVGDVTVLEVETSKSFTCIDRNDYVTTDENNCVQKEVRIKTTPYLFPKEIQAVTLEFNSPINPNSIVAEAETMYWQVSDKQYEVSARIDSYDDSVVRISAPMLELHIQNLKTDNTQSFYDGIHYNLQISENFQSIGGNNLTELQSILFYFLDDYIFYDYDPEYV